MEIGSPEKLRSLDKTYKPVAGCGYEHPWMIGGWPDVQVPVELREGVPVTVKLHCFDNVQEAARLGRLREVRVRLMMPFPPRSTSFV